MSAADDELVALMNLKPDSIFQVGSIVAITDATHIQVTIGTTTKPVRVPSEYIGMTDVGQLIRVNVQDNSYVLDCFLSQMGGGFMPVASSVDYYGTILPYGFLWADGSTFDGGIYPLLAIRLGGTTLPDRRERVSVGYKAGSSYAGTLKATGGDADAIVVSHTHSYNNQSNNTSPPRGTGADWTVAAIADVPHTTGSTGSSGTNKNLQPYTVCNVIIRAL